MSAAPQIRLKVTRPLWAAGATSPAGAELSCGALQAHDLLASGRVELIDPRDLVEIQRAVWNHTKKVCPPSPGDPGRIYGR